MGDNSHIALYGNLHDLQRPDSPELRIRRSLTSAAEINRAGQGRTWAPMPSL
ncbi:hypothetical protein GCM10010231_66780 [Streptomyces sindenensis]|nr:hypothetical protein GCM10010231_66780 [Streptomyces sindenensis]